MNQFSLYELNQHLRRVISFNLSEPLWIKAEIADVNFHKNSCYISLVERDDFQLKARADASIWANNLQKMQQKIDENILGQLLQKGSQVLILVLVEYQEQYGLRLSIQDIDLNFTLGKLEQDKIETWSKLDKAELINKNKSLFLPTVCKRIAVISSPEAAGYQDFMQQLENNPFGFSFETQLFPATMQGLAVGKDILAQMATIAHQKSIFDCIVIVRGGGAKLDLAAFDEFLTCGAIANAPLAVLTGIGHEIDISLADKVAHTQLKTPTAVADFLINRFVMLQNQLDSFKNRLKNAYTYHVLQKQNKLQQLKTRFAQAQIEHVLSRGFAVLLDKDGNRITTIFQLQAIKNLTVRLADGTINLQVC
jgi:exodeoxyribonuclease VII large subunit